MTTTEASLGRVKDIVDEYVRVGFERIFLRPLSPYGFAIRTSLIRPTMPISGSISIFRVSITLSNSIRMGLSLRKAMPASSSARF